MSEGWMASQVTDGSLNPIDACGAIIAFTPPASTATHSPDQTAWQAREIATSADEQAVSTEPPHFEIIRPETVALG